jgi:hypothetical protein
MLSYFQEIIKMLNLKYFCFILLYFALINCAPNDVTTHKSEMSSNMELHVVSKTLELLEKGSDLNEIAKKIIEEMDNTYGPTWICKTGINSNFTGVNFNAKERTFIWFSVKDKDFVVYQQSSEIHVISKSTVAHPTTAPTTVPTTVSTTAPTAAPATAPTTVPTTAPTTAPTTVPTIAPTTAPTAVPTTVSTTVPTTVSPTHVTIQTIHTEVTENLTTHSVTTTSSSHVLSRSLCKTEGYFRNPHDCTLYYRCVEVDGLLTLYDYSHQPCASGLVFDEDQRTCVIKEDSKPCHNQP